MSTSARSRLLSTAALAIFVAGVALPASAQTTLTMWSFLDPSKNTPRERVLRQIIEDYERRNPNIKVRVEPQVWHQIANKFTISASTRTAPDIAWVNYPSLVLPFSANVAADLGALAFNRWGPSEWDDYVTRAPIEAGSQGGKLLAAPIMLLSNSLLYRKDIFATAGITAADVKTWDGLLAVAKRLTTTVPGGTIWGLGLPLSRDGASQPLMAVGLTDLQPRVFDDKCVPTVATPAGERTIQMAARFVTERASSPEALAQTSDDSQELFIGGRQAITVGGTSRVGSIRERATFDKTQVGVLPWPSWTGEKSGPFILDGWTAVVWSGSPRARQAAEFVAYMVGRETAAAWTLEGGQVPFRKSVLARPELDTPENSWMRDVAAGWAQNATFLPPQCNVGAFYSDLNLAVQKVVRGTATPMNALREVEAQGRERNR